MRTLAVLVLLCVPSVATADIPEATLPTGAVKHLDGGTVNQPSGVATQSEVNKVRKVRENFALIDEWEKRKILTPEEAEKARRLQFFDASVLAHKPLNSVAEIDAFLLERQDFLTKAGNLVTFTNIMLTVACIAFIVAVGWLIGLYFMIILLHIPLAVYEVLLYAACIAGITQADTVGAWLGLDPIWFVFPSCLGLLGALWATYGIHIATAPGSNPFDRGWLYWGNSGKPNGTLNFTTFASLVCAVVWGAVAVLHQSDMIAFISTMSLMSFLGFSVFVAPFCIGLGYDDEDTIARTTFASFLILMVGVATRISGLDLGKFQVFAWSFLWLGTFVYFCSMLIVANKWYSKENYWLLTFVTLASGVAALYLGSVYDIPVLQKMGGTFFFIWVVEKYFEIPWGKEGWAWGLLIGSIALFFLGRFAQHHPEYFLFNGVPASQAGVTSHVK